MSTKIYLHKLIAALIVLLATSNSSAQTLDWARQIGNSNWDNCFGTAVDDNMNFYAVGFFEDTIDFDPGIGQLSIASNGQSDGYILKLDSNGNFVWLRKVIGVENQLCLSIKIMGSKLYVAGDFKGSAIFDPGQTNYILTAMSNSYSDIYVMEMDTAGNFKWVKQLMGTAGMSVRELNLDYTYNILLTGTFLGTVDFNPDIIGSYTLTSAGGRDVFVCKLDTGGNFIWAKQIGGTGVYQDGNSIDVDGIGDVYVTGEFNGTIDLDPGIGVFSLSTSTTVLADMDVFICKLDSGGNFIWGMGFGSIDGEFANKILYDGDEHIYISGGFSNTIDFDYGPGVFTMTATGGGDAFLLKLDTAGAFAWSKQWGNINSVSAIASIDNLGNLYCSGSFVATMDADPGAGVYNITGSPVYSNSYIIKLNNQGNFVWATDFNGTWTNAIRGLVHDNSGNIYTRGDFNNVVDCDPGTGTYNLTSNGSYDVFFMKLSQPLVSVIHQPEDLETNVVAYPNPTKGETTITSPLPVKSLKLLTVTGSVAFSKENVNAYKEVVEVNELPQGIYFISVETQKGIAVKKLVVMKE
jgi:Secretion system C-terminal sorting domain